MSFKLIKRTILSFGVVSVFLSPMARSDFGKDLGASEFTALGEGPGKAAGSGFGGAIGGDVGGAVGGESVTGRISLFFSNNETPDEKIPGELQQINKDLQAINTDVKALRSLFIEGILEEENHNTATALSPYTAPIDQYWDFYTSLIGNGIEGDTNRDV